MRRSLWSRSFAAVLSAWFAVVTVDPTLVHSCPMHQGELDRNAPGGQPSALIPTAGETHGHDARHADAAAEHQEQEQSCCTCIGQCGAPPSAWSPALGAMSMAIAVAMVDRGVPDYAYVPVAAAHVLPFANGPPIRA